MHIRVDGGISSDQDRFSSIHEYRISSPISQAIFSVFNPKFWEIFHKERGSACSRGF